MLRHLEEHLQRQRTGREYWEARAAPLLGVSAAHDFIGEENLVALGPPPSGGWGGLHGLAAELLRLKVDILAFFVAFSKP